MHSCCFHIIATVLVGLVRVGGIDGWMDGVFLVGFDLLTLVSVN